MNKNQVEKVIWWAYIILLFAIVVKFKGSFVELRDRITSYSSQEAVVFNVIPFRNIETRFGNRYHKTIGEKATGRNHFNIYRI